MNKKIVIIVISIVLVLGIIGSILLLSKKEDNNGNHDNGSITIITLDINPSIEIKVKNDIVESIKALNDDAKNVLDMDLKDKSLEEALRWIMNRSVDLNYIEGEQAVVLVMIDGKIDEEELRRLMANP